MLERNLKNELLGTTTHYQYSTKRIIIKKCILNSFPHYQFPLKKAKLQYNCVFLVGITNNLLLYTFQQFQEDLDFLAQLQLFPTSR